jgi:hypothetical protein
MIKLKEFMANNNQSPDLDDQEIEILEAEELPDFVVEDDSEEPRQNHSKPHDPPMVLIMRRKQIRQFPNGQKVALYYVDKINKYITVPYSSMQWSASVEEEVEQVEESVMHHLQKIVDGNTARAIKFKDGKTMKVDKVTASAVLKVHGALNGDNQKKLSDMAHKSKEHFGRVVDFAWKHVK